MSTVLWANYLVDGSVTCDESDKYALLEHADALDALCREHGVMPFLETQDSTDLEFNVGGDELPDGTESTDELMAAKGHWVDARTAVTMLETLLRVIGNPDSAPTSLAGARDELVEELEESLAFARTAVEKSARFNFSIVM